MKLQRSIVRRSHFGVVLAIPLLAFVWYAGLSPFDGDAALAAFVIAIAPTAAAAPVITSFLEGKVAYVTFAVLLNSCAVGFIIPLSLPFLLDTQTAISIFDILLPVLSVMFIPLSLALLIRYFLPSLQDWLLRYKVVSYYLFLANVYIAMSRATWFIRFESGASLESLLAIGLASLGVCLSSFGLGFLLDRRGQGLEASMALGRKNTMFALWVSLTFVNPLTAMGPMFYILWQNAFNTVQLWLKDRRRN
jgi:BASS family bile acid:Na+ symporter